MLIIVAVCPCGHVGETVMCNPKPCVFMCQIIMWSIHFRYRIAPPKTNILLVCGQCCIEVLPMNFISLKWQC